MKMLLIILPMFFLTTLECLFKGNVSSINKEPIIFAHLSLSDKDGKLLYEGWTNEDGDFLFPHIEINDGVCILDVSHQEFKNYRDTLTFVPNEVKRLNIIMIPR
ncbi:MAG: hypothetical protein VR77_06180 [Flavobacteriales bacterium BRH_c54]|nr:MAG: hypothetical protein VR77_06180 [Flavobacteriales bacterium BRH_c54]